MGNGNGYGGAPEDQFANLYDIIATNDRLSDHQHPTVFAAYINYDKADNGNTAQATTWSIRLVPCLPMR